MHSLFQCILKHFAILFFLVDQIYHLASPASPPNYMYNPIKTLKTNTIGTLNMLGKCCHTSFASCDSRVYAVYLYVCVLKMRNWPPFLLASVVIFLYSPTYNEKRVKWVIGWVKALHFSIAVSWILVLSLHHFALPWWGVIVNTGALHLFCFIFPPLEKQITFYYTSSQVCY